MPITAVMPALIHIQPAGEKSLFSPPSTSSVPSGALQTSQTVFMGWFSTPHFEQIAIKDMSASPRRS